MVAEFLRFRSQRTVFHAAATGVTGVTPRKSRHQREVLALLSVVGITCTAFPNPVLATPWPRHTIDATSRGADGARLGDVNRDGRPDLVTGWEEGGVVRVYLPPSPTESFRHTAVADDRSATRQQL